MAIKYKVIEMINPQAPKGAKRYGAQTIWGKELNFDMICDFISERCSLTDSDVEAVLQAFITNVTIFVLNSMNVDLGKLGYMTGALKTDLIDNPETYTKSNIRSMHMVFVPSSSLKAELLKASFLRVGKPKKKD